MTGSPTGPADGVGRDVERVQGQRDRGEPAHEDGDIHDPFVADERLGPLEQAGRHHPRLRERDGELVDVFLPRIFKGGRKVCD